MDLSGRSRTRRAVAHPPGPKNEKELRRELQRRIQDMRLGAAEKLTVRADVYATMRKKEDRSLKDRLLFDFWARLKVTNRWGEKMAFEVKLPDEKTFQEFAKFRRPPRTRRKKDEGC